MGTGAVSVVATVVRRPALLRVELAYLAFTISEYATWLAILVFAFERGGATGAALVSVLMLVPSAIVAPIAAAFGDRYRRDRYLKYSYLAQAAAVGATGVLMVARAPIALVYAVAAVAFVSMTLTRPAQGSLVPMLVTSPEELVAVNAVSGGIESISFIIGPAAAGLLMGISNPGVVFIVMAAVVAASVLFVHGVAVDEEPTETEEPLSALRGSLEGFARLAGQADARLIIVLVASEWLVLGALDLLIVVLAISLLGLGTGGPGLLNAAVGVGGLVGTTAGLALVTRRRLTPALALGVLMVGAPVAIIGWHPETLLALVMLAVAGVGHVVMDVAGRSLLQRAVSEDLLARAFGALEGLTMAALAVGTLLASALVAWLGGRWALVVSGLILPAVVAASWRSLRRIDAHAPPPVELMDLLRSVPMFAPLPPLSLERLATSAGVRETPAGGTIVQEGKPGRRFYVIGHGRVRVMRGTKVVAELAEGDSFGEIALIRDVPRTASVVATTDVLTHTLDREVFLRSLSGNPAGTRAADRVISERTPGPG